MKRVLILAGKLTLHVVKRGSITGHQRRVLEPELFDHPLAGHRRHAIEHSSGRGDHEAGSSGSMPRTDHIAAFRGGDCLFRNQPRHQHVPVPFILRQLRYRNT